MNTSRDLARRAGRNNTMTDEVELSDLEILKRHKGNGGDQEAADLAFGDWQHVEWIPFGSGGRTKDKLKNIPEIDQRIPVPQTNVNASVFASSRAT